MPEGSIPEHFNLSRNTPFKYAEARVMVTYRLHTILMLFGLFVGLGTLRLEAAPSESDGGKPKTSTTDSDAKAREVETKIATLIEQLGANSFAERRLAESKLLQYGFDAFDLLKEAEENVDPEIAARASYLSKRVTVTWAKQDDPIAAREIMQDYASKSDEDRMQVIEVQIPSLEPGIQTDVLCRIVRFDRSIDVSCYAAMMIAMPERGNHRVFRYRGGDIRNGDKKPADEDRIAKSKAQQTKTITAGLGNSRRIGAKWLRTYLLEMNDPAAALSEWESHTKAYRDLTKDRFDALVVVYKLLHKQAQLYDTLGKNSELYATWKEMLELDVNGETILPQWLDFLASKDRWEQLDTSIKENAGKLADRTALIYNIATKFAEKGDTKRAEEIAQRAFDLASNSSVRFEAATSLYLRHHRYDWSSREFEKIVKDEPINSWEALQAYNYLPQLYFEMERYEDAAKTLGKLLDATTDKQIQREIASSFASNMVQLRAKQDYYWACHYKLAKDYQKQKEYLDKAILKLPSDIDVLIDRYQLKNAGLKEVDEAYMEKSKSMVERCAEGLERDIENAPEMIVSYNNLAWLIANTEGDRDKALKYAQRAVNESPEETKPGYIDTLARVYYARGDLENAIKYQKEAVEMQPYTMQMQRQLRNFEAELKEKQSEKESAKGA